MSVAIGRISPVHLTNIAAVSRGRGSLTIGGRVAAFDPALTAAVASQIDGLSTDLDDPVVPVMFTGEHAGLSHLDGFYRVSDVGFDIGAGVVDPVHPIGYPEWSVTLDPVRDRSCPRIESVLESVLRTNSVAVLASTSKVDPWHAVPAGSTVYDDGSGQDLRVATSVTTATGDIYWGKDSTNNPPRRGVSTWRCPPAAWYQGAAAVERLWDSTWLPLVGRDTSMADGDTSWRISNGLVRFGPQTTDNSTFDIECYGSGAWQSTTTIRMPLYASPPFSPTEYVQASSVSIIRNNPAEVRVRITGQATAATPTITVDLRLRRGQPWVDIHWSIPNSAVSYGVPDSLTISPAPTWSAIAGGGGQVSTADADGNKLVQFYPVASSNSTETTWETAIGWEISGFPVDNTYLKGEYFAPTAEFVRLVGA